MKASALAVFLLGATLMIAGCNGASDDVIRSSPPADRQSTDTAATGTSGSQSNASGAAPAPRDLPDTASPLVLIAGIGGLSLGAAGALRLLRSA